MQQKIIPVLERLLSLLVVFLLLAGTTLWSGRFWGNDWLSGSATDTVEVAAEGIPPNRAEREALGLTDCRLMPSGISMWQVRAVSGDERGVVVSSRLLAPKVTGYAGPTPLYVYIGPDERVRAVVAAENDETPHFFRRAADRLLHAWDGLTVDEALAQQVDGVTGATYTSLSLKGHMQAVLAAYVRSEGVRQTVPAIGWERTAAVLGVLLLGMVVAWRFRGIRWLRLLVLLLNVGVTGFWCGQFLSLSLMQGWLKGGVDVWLYLPTVAMLVVAVVLPYCGRSRHYCTWVCPYGSLQELVWWLPVPKIRVVAAYYRWLSRIRMAVLSILLLMLWMGWGMTVLDYEPFGAFQFSSAAPAVIVLAGIFVLAGMFVPRPWCKGVCPIGTLLSLAEEKK